MGHRAIHLTKAGSARSRSIENTGYSLDTCAPIEFGFNNVDCALPSVQLAHHELIHAQPREGRVGRLSPKDGLALEETSTKAVDPSDPIGLVRLQRNNLGNGSQDLAQRYVFGLDQADSTSD